MSLQTELDAFQAAWKQRAGGDVAATFAADNEALLRSGLVERALRAGAKFPDLTLANARGGQTRIYDVLARGARNLCPRPRRPDRARLRGSGLSQAAGAGDRDRGYAQDQGGGDDVAFAASTKVSIAGDL